jgi:DNA-binding HxlR family transcriptional regulator
VADGKGHARAPREHRRAEARALESIGGLAAGEGSEGLDPLIHSRIRLGILSALAIADRMSFNELRDLLKTTDGNLSVHGRKLEKAGYVACDKTFQERLPHTEYRLTAAGRKALERYLDHMEALIQATRD